MIVQDYYVMIVQGKDEVLFQKDKGRREMPSPKLKSTVAKVTKRFQKGYGGNRFYEVFNSQKWVMNSF